MPIDLIAMSQLDASHQSMFKWLSYRLPMLKKPLQLPLKTILPQFYEINDPRQASAYAAKFWKGIYQVKTIYTTANVERCNDGRAILLKPSPYHIKRSEAKAWIRRPSEVLVDDQSI